MEVSRENSWPRKICKNFKDQVLVLRYFYHTRFSRLNFEGSWQHGRQVFQVIRVPRDTRVTVGVQISEVVPVPGDVLTAAKRHSCTRRYPSTRTLSGTRPKKNINYPTRPDPKKCSTRAHPCKKKRLEEFHIFVIYYLYRVLTPNPNQDADHCVTQHL